MRHVLWMLSTARICECVWILPDSASVQYAAPYRKSWLCIAQNTWTWTSGKRWRACILHNVFDRIHTSQAYGSISLYSSLLFFFFCFWISTVLYLIFVIWENNRELSCFVGHKNRKRWKVFMGVMEGNGKVVYILLFSFSEKLITKFMSMTP